MCEQASGCGKVNVVEDREGVIKFRSVHEQRRLDGRRLTRRVGALDAWRSVLVPLGLVGADPRRYDGLGFGNLSTRVGAMQASPGARSFVITGTQTGALKELMLEHFCVVQRYDSTTHTVHSYGQVQPSSESVTHGAIYDLSLGIRAVVHVHAPTLWRHAAALGLPTTAADVPYGTSAMAEEVMRLYRETALPRLRLLAMAGHEDGVIAFGRRIDEAATALLRAVARAIEYDVAARQ